jgi:hypothetical protein
MFRTLACAALLIAAIPSAAQTADTFRFEIRPEGSGTVSLRIKRSTEPGDHDSWSRSVPLADLQGFDRAAAQRGGPVSFHLTRPAGRFDCAGQGHDSEAEGRCQLILDPGYVARLSAHGLARPTEREGFQLVMSGVSTDVLDALQAERWAQPTVSQLVQAGIFHVDAAMIRGLARAGYKGGTMKTLVDFAIFHVTPDYVRTMRAAGLGDQPGATLVKLRMFNVTPDDLRTLAGSGHAAPSAGQLMKLRMAGLDRRDIGTRN